MSESGNLVGRTNRAVEAAAAVARELGITVIEPRVLHDAFSVVVHLSPAPLVARIPVVLPPGLERAELIARQRRELGIVEWLAARGEPVVVPSPLVPVQPVVHEGFSMTFWTLVEIDATVTPDYVASAGLAAALHATMREYPGELPFLWPVHATVPPGLAFLADHPELIAAADLDRARREWAALEPVLTSSESFAAAFPRGTVQPIHGDAPSYNLIHATSGIRYADFEDVTLGPPEWDLALFGPAAAATYDAEAARRSLRVLEPDVQRAMDTARALQVVASLALVPQLPLLATGLMPMLELWRASPPYLGVQE